MNLRDMYGIYQKFNNFLEEEQTEPQKKLQNMATNVIQYGEDIKNKIKNKFEEKLPPRQEQPRQNGIWDKVERSWTNRQQMPNSVSPRRRKITTEVDLDIPKDLQEYANIIPPPTNSSGRGSRRIFSNVTKSPAKLQTDFLQIQNFKNKLVLGQKKNKNKQSKQSQPPQSRRLFSRDDALKSSDRSSNDLSNLEINSVDTSFSQNSNQKIDRTLFLIEKEDEKVIDPMFYKENNEAEIIFTLIQKLGSKPNIEKETALEEKLQIQLQNINTQIKKEINDHNALQQNGFLIMDGLAFRMNSCFARVKQSRESIKQIRQELTIRSAKISQSIKDKALKDQQRYFLQKFKERYTVILSLVRELQQECKYSINSKSWTLDQINQAMVKAQRGLSDPVEQQFMQNFTCFQNITESINSYYQQMLQNSYTFFTQNLIQAFIFYDSQKSVLQHTVLQMAERIVALQKNHDFQSKHFASAEIQIPSLKKQFRAIYNKKNPMKPPFSTLQSLNIYLKAFTLGLYEFAYGFTSATKMFSLIGNKSIPLSQLADRFQQQSSKNLIWDYIQQKLSQILIQLKIEDKDDISNTEIHNFLLLLDRIFKIGEELSQQSSRKLIMQTERSIRLIVQIIATRVLHNIVNQTFPFQTNTIQKLPDMFKKPLYQLERIGIQTQYLQTLINPNELLVEFKLTQTQGANPKNDPDLATLDIIVPDIEINILQQIQRLQSIAESIPFICLECIQHAMNAFDILTYVYLTQNYAHYAKLTKQISSIPKNVSINQLAQIHQQCIFLQDYQNVSQLLMRSIDLFTILKIDIKKTKTLKLKKNTFQNILDSMKEWFGAICTDRDFWTHLVNRANQSCYEMERLIISQNILKQFSYNSSDPRSSEVIIQQFKLQRQGQILSNQKIAEIYANVLIEQLCEQLCPQIKTNQRAIFDIKKVVQDLTLIIGSQGCSKFTLQLKRLLEQKMIENIHLSVLKNPEFPLIISMNFCDLKNSSFVNQVTKEYSNFIEKNM